MKPAQPFSFQYLPLLIRLECREAVQLPLYLGSTLHGIVGWVLSSSTAYTYLYENRAFGGGKQDIVNPYLIEPPKPRGAYHVGDLLTFKLVLLGDAVQHAEAVVRAFVKAGVIGFGAGRKAFRLFDILQAESLLPLWKGVESQVEAGYPAVMSTRTNENTTIAPTLLLPEQLQTLRLETVQWCSVHLVTPLRIRRGGELVLHIDFATIMRNIVRRLTAVTERYGGEVDQERGLTLCEQATAIHLQASSLYKYEMNRYSSRRKEKMDFSGLLGAVTFEGDLAAFTPWLQAAEVLHIGRNSTFGCGQIDIVFG